MILMCLNNKRNLEKEMSTHSNIPVWRTPWTEETGGLQSMGSERVGHNLVTEQQQQKKTLNLSVGVGW